MQRLGLRAAHVLPLAASLLLAIACGGGDEAERPPATQPTPDREAGAPASAPPGSTGSASITGSARYEGDIPNLPPIKMDADPGCAKKHPGGTSQPTMLVLGDDRQLANVFVRVVGGLPAGSWPPPSEPAVLDQEGCEYEPHVLGLMAGQTLKILNSDGLLHNIHALPDENAEFNRAMPAAVAEITHVFEEPEFMFRIKCDVHPWMGAFVSVMEHPFFAVTGTDGTFEIEGLPAGTYEIEAWHERLGTRTATVTLADGQTTSESFTFSPQG